ncbi:MAG: peptidase M17 [Flavobacteriales bacterium]|nr:peptidase M17 [Flavobacteriales bacterium]|tara:strand:- start:7759 stop:9186 length:1428 start_codon:yes stop_codon:yes gene_type:complete
MYSIINKTKESSSKIDLVVLAENQSNWSSLGLSPSELDYLISELNTEQSSIHINQYSRRLYIEIISSQTSKSLACEKVRERGAILAKLLNLAKIEKVGIESLHSTDFSLVLAEGIALANYQFLKYFKDSASKKNSLKEILVRSEYSKIDQLNAVISGTLHARDLVNEPLSYLNAMKFSEEMSRLGDESGFDVETLYKNQIEDLKMGGLLAVNKGAVEPPTFNILTHHPKNAANEDPIVLVGKGIVYDTGGLSLKPTANSMDIMKCDMGGGASVVGILYALAKAKVPIYVVGLIPATENRPGGNAYAPGDVIHMMDNTSVEVLNTDAEGRLVLADALCYAKKYKPELVIDFATLTGAAVRAIGKYGIVAMGNTSKSVQDDLIESGENVYERLAIMPFWDEYADLLKSDIADMTNLGPAEAGQITAGKFLEHFTDYPWLHFDIAGPAFLSNDDHYRLKGGTGSGVRIIFDYLMRKTL